MLTTRASATFILALLLAACGQKGTLVLEDDEVSSAPAPTDQTSVEPMAEADEGEGGEDEDEGAPDP